MKQSLIQQLGRSARLKVVNELKRTQGLCVNDLATRLHMSYMGVKSICLELEKRGLLDKRRHPSKIGRPTLLYRLTERAHDLFPTESNALTLDLLEAAQKLFGANAPEKLIMVVFQKVAEGYLEKLHSREPVERAKQLARARDREGCMSEYVEAETPEGEPRIVEHHSPILDVLREYPVVARFESQMIEQLLGRPVRREESTASGLFRVTYFLPGR